jgi:hypothetical protein
MTRSNVVPERGGDRMKIAGGFFVEVWSADGGKGLINYLT